MQTKRGFRWIACSVVIALALAPGWLAGTPAYTAAASVDGVAPVGPVRAHDPSAPHAFDVVQIAAEGAHACALTSGGAVRCWGDNSFGQLGTGAYDNGQSTPTAVAGMNGPVSRITAGAAHMCALMATGTVKCWGDNQAGQLGINWEVTESNIPTDVVGLNNVSAIAGGGAHTCALVNTGVKCWGNNLYGQLGSMVESTYAPVDVPGLSGVTAIDAGWAHTCARLTNGTVKCWGFNEYGQLGIGDAPGNVTTPTLVISLTDASNITLGDIHSCATLSGGGAKCWGGNSGGALGDGTFDNRNAPVAVSGLSSGVLGLRAGGTHTCARTSGGLKCWGANSRGQLGDGTTQARNTPTLVSGFLGTATVLALGYEFSCALTSANMQCWGDNHDVQIGTGTRTQWAEPQPVAALGVTASAVAASNNFTCASLVGGTMQCWGAGGSFQLGNGSSLDSSTPVNVSGLTGVTAFATGYYHACAIAGGVKCWGSGSYGELGRKASYSAVPTDVIGLGGTPTAIAVGSAFNCAVVNGGAKCWGYNNYGQLGDGGTTRHYTPTDVVGLTSGVLAVAAGGAHACAVVTGGGVKCWGWDQYGQLGDGTTTISRTTPVDVPGLSGVVQLSLGYLHSCARTNAGQIKCWGHNAYGQLGDGTIQQRSSPATTLGFPGDAAGLSAGAYHSCARNTAGAVKCWGYNGYGQIGDGSQSSRNAPVQTLGLTSGVDSVSAGVYHTCARLAGGAVRCWGSDDVGQLGIGRALQYTLPQVVLWLTPRALLPMMAR